MVGEDVRCCTPAWRRGDRHARCRRRRGPSRGAGSRRRAGCASVTSTGASTRPTPDVTTAVAPSAQAEPRGVVGMHLQRAARPALHQHLDVVHPRVVRAQVAPADEQQLAVGASAMRPSPPPAVAGRRRARVGRQLDRARSACAAPRAAAARAAPKSMPWGWSAQLVERVQAVRGSAPKPSPYGPVRTMRSRRRSGRAGRRRRAPSRISSGSRPAIGPVASPTACSTRPAIISVVDDRRVGVGALALRR